MKKKICFLLILIFMYIIIQILLDKINNRYELYYTLNTDNQLFDIYEEYNNHIANSYYINIIHDDKVYSYQWDTKNYGKNIITDIKYYHDDNLECILPVFKGKKIIFDITCQSDSNIQYYHNMENVSEGLQSFIHSINDIYSAENFNDEIDNMIEHDIISINEQNILDDKILSIETYKGIINIKTSKKVFEEINLFDKDQYKRSISSYTDDYYFVADYNQLYEFNKFYIVNLRTNEVKELSFNYYISFDSYIQGIEENTVYLFDMEAKEQYKIDCKRLTIEEIGNLNDNIQIYKDGKWIEESVYNVVKNKEIFEFFEFKVLDNGNKYIVTYNNYIYTYEKNKKGFAIYKSNKLTPNIKNYLFDIDNIDSIIYIDDYMFFKNQNCISYYNDKIGLKKIIQSNELFFNTDILYTIINK